MSLLIISIVTIYLLTNYIVLQSLDDTNKVEIYVEGFKFPDFTKINRKNN